MNPVNLIYLLLIIIAVIIAFAYVRCFFKRLMCLFSIRRVCRKNGFTLRSTHPLWFLGSRYFKQCDCLIEAPDTVFAVKLFGCLWPLKSLILRERGEYFFRAHSSFLAPILDVLDGYPHALPKYRFGHKRIPLPEGKVQRNVLLVNPAPLEMRLQPSSGLESISGPGDVLFGMEIATLSHLARIVENAAGPRG